MSDFFCNFADRLTPCVFQEWKRGGRKIKIKGVYYASYLGTSKVYQHLKPVKNEDVINAHGYVYTYPGSFYAFIGMEWVWGIIHIGVGFCNTHSLVKELVPPRCADESNSTDTHPFSINSVAVGYWRHLFKRIIKGSLVP